MLTCDGLSKWFGRAKVLDDVSFDVRAGEIHAIVGENGAGKSTLTKIIAGLHQPDGGSVTFDGEHVTFGSPAAANLAGVALIHQEPRIFPDLSVIENMWVDDRGTPWWKRSYRRRSFQVEARESLIRLGCPVSLNTRMSELSVANQQLVDVAAAMQRNLKLLIVDEPTASLTPSEVDALFDVLDSLRDDGVAIIFIGHRLEEILRISDRITVLRDGKFIKALDTADTDEDELVRLMVGRDIPPLDISQIREGSERVLTVDGLSSGRVFRDVSLELYAGEILGIGGLVGAGRSELLETIFGRRRRSGGSVTLQGESVGSTTDAIRRGIALVPEDRALNGLVLPATIHENLALPNLFWLSKSGLWRDRRRERELAQQSVKKMDVRSRGDTDTVIGLLSGGNQQKVSVAKWLQRGELTVLMVDEPTRGVDIGAKSEIHSLLKSLADEGLAVLVVSSDMRELLAVSDRLLIMREGLVAGELSREDATEENVLRLAAGAVA